ncbi:MAG TPA: UDP-N-acetylmuramate--alanine ligase [Octadecabacter sp.]|nr:UDP-N-acetylmuramate--alanine ligase [Octadecabacter sp.]
MSWSIVIAALWVLVATGTALLPIRGQFVPGVALLLMAPGLIIWLGYDFGWGWSVAAFLAFASMFRNPLKYLIARARGLRPEIPK